MRKQTESVEDYLKAIYTLSENEERVSTNELAEILKIKPASVTGMLKKLAGQDAPLVDYISHRGVLLTEYGRQMALETLRHHRLLETFLVEVLGFEWDEVHEEAEKLEHFISEKLEERIDEYLGYPKFDPHGDPIPSSDLSMPDFSQKRLSDIKTGHNMLISRVSTHDSNLLQYLQHKGIIPGTVFSIIEYSEFDENHSIKVESKEETVVLGKKITRHIFIDQTE